MAKVKIQGNASGTGVLTVTAPNTSTDRTVTLPDATGTLLMTDGDGSSLTGLSHTPEGTAVLSTGETGGTKFLREDGDNTSSWQTVPAGGVDGIVSSADATAMTITSAERIGVGDTTPDAKLEIYATSETALNVVSSVSGEYTAQFKSGSTNATPIIHCQDSAAATILQVLADGRGLSQFTAKAWVNFNGTGTVAIRDSHNVSSITDNGTALYTVNYTNNMANVDYSNVGSVQGDTKVFTIVAATVSSSQVEIRQSTDGTKADVAKVCMQVFGD